MSDKFLLSGECIDDQEPHLYRACGLEGIYLLNGFVIEEHDGDESVSIRDIDGLHLAIGKHIVRHRKALSPKEIRFLRNTMDLTQAQLAEAVGKTSQSVARWEKGEIEMPTAEEKLLRIFFLVRCMSDDELHEFREFLSNRMSEMDEMDELFTHPVQFCLGEHWAEKAA